MESFEHSDVIIDQLGEVRREFYAGSIRAREWEPDQEDPNQHPSELHAYVQEDLDGNEPVLMVVPSQAGRLGETALYAAFVELSRPEVNIVFEGYNVRIDLYDLPAIPTAYMSNGEITRRFDNIYGPILTTQEKQEIVAKALLIVAHFRRLHPISLDESPDTSQGDQSPPNA